jgi:hypothetical protein
MASMEYLFSAKRRRKFFIAKRQANFLREAYSAKTRYTALRLRVRRINNHMPRTFYLPDQHAFEHIATAHWPLKFTAYNQLDWIAAVDEMESWLNCYIGSHYSAWAYHNGTSVDYWQACIAFKKPTYKTLFLLQWT